MREVVKMLGGHDLEIFIMGIICILLGIKWGTRQ